jgi:membrane protease YdiL (CAAX protease family)
MFALAHWPQGPSGMLLTGTLAILFGLLFLQQRQNLWANVVAHITGDTASLVLIAVSADHWLDPLGRSLWGLS